MHPLVYYIFMFSGTLEILGRNRERRKKHNENKLIWLYESSFVTNLMVSIPRSAE